jgi:putative membrane protein
MFPIISQKTSIRLPARRAGRLIGVVSLLVVLLVALLLMAPHGTLLRLNGLSQADVAWLPRFHAALNGASAMLLTAAYLFIRRRQIKYHRFCMHSAFALSTLFLFSYVIYHAIAGSTRFSGPPSIRPIYLAILLSHIVLAITVLPLVLTTLYRAWQGTFIQHGRIARWTLPIWLYVSVSGVLVYLLLYFWN